MSKHHFFEPYVGNHYKEGIHGKKILVLGASFYCNCVKCPFFASCTSVILKDSSEFDNKCPEYKSAGKQLHLEPGYCVEDAPTTYQRFAAYMGKHLGTEDYDTVWEHLAFTNYVQFFLPATNGSFRETMWSDLSERDFAAFTEVVQQLQPDIVVVWGNVINSALKERNPYLVDMKELQETEYYVCHLDVPGVNHPVAVINPYHPSSGAWYSDQEKFDNYFSNLLK
jgi:hypothetical protein